MTRTRKCLIILCSATPTSHSHYGHKQVRPEYTPVLPFPHGRAAELNVTRSLFRSEPLGGVVEGISAGLFLIGMMIAITALLIYRQRVRKV